MEIKDWKLRMTRGIHPVSWAVPTDYPNAWFASFPQSKFTAIDTLSPLSNLFLLNIVNIVNLISVGQEIYADKGNWMSGWLLVVTFLARRLAFDESMYACLLCTNGTVESSRHYPLDWRKKQFCALDFSLLVIVSWAWEFEKPPGYLFFASVKLAS